MSATQINQPGQKKPSAVLEAEAVLKEAKELAKDNPNVLAAGGYVSYVHSRTVASPAKKDLYLEAGEKLSRRALKLNPDILIAYQTLGLVRLAQDDLDEAVDPLRRAVALSESAANLTLLAQSLLRLNPKDPEAAGLVESALGKHPHYHPAILAKALLLANQGQQEEGFMLAGDIPESARNADWHLVRGDIYRKQGDGPAALAAWREAIRLLDIPYGPEPLPEAGSYP